MVMKLLPKSEIDRRKAVEQKTAVDEGLKLARKVDNLRQTVAEEDAALQKFRKETLATIHDEISKEVKKRDELKQEVSVLEDRRVKLQVPLDEAWASLREEDDRAKTRREELVAGELALKDKDRETEVISKRASVLLAKATTKEDLADHKLSDAAHALEEAESARAVARRIKEDTEKVADKTRKELFHRDMMASARERDATLREEAVAKAEAFIRDEKIRLTDRELTLERDLKRIKKYNG